MARLLGIASLVPDRGDIVDRDGQPLARTIDAWTIAVHPTKIIGDKLARSSAPEVIFISPCECQGFHGKNRWIVKTDFTPVPLDKSAIQSVTPSQIYAWEGLAPDVDLLHQVEARMPSEEKWYALTGRVVDAKVEADGDIHLALEDATGSNLGTVSAEIPVGPKWCEIRQTVFGWTEQTFPFSVKTAHALKFRGRISSR